MSFLECTVVNMQDSAEPINDSEAKSSTTVDKCCGTLVRILCRMMMLVDGLWLLEGRNGNPVNSLRISINLVPLYTRLLPHSLLQFIINLRLLTRKKNRKFLVIIPAKILLIGPRGTELRHILAIYIMCPWPLTYFSKNWVSWPRVLVECIRLFGRRFSFWNIKS